jgi:hypothetical protein
MLPRKELRMSTNQMIICGALAVLLSLGGIPRYGRAQGTAVPPVERTASGIPYLSGGVGLEEQDALRAVSGDYNLHVTLAQRDGHYLSDARVTIRDGNGATLLETVARGPWLFTTLPPGKYTVTADLQGKAQQRLTQVPAAGHAEVNFYW